MTTIKITPAFAAEMEALRAAGKTVWLIVREDYAVGPYASRTEARADKAIDQIQGKVVRADEVTIEVVDLTAGSTGASQVLADEVDGQDPTKAEVATSNEDPTETDIIEGNEVTTFPVADLTQLHNGRCPKCGSFEVYNGRAANPKEGITTIVDENFITGCHHCDWEVDTRKVITHKSTAERPCQRTWIIADDMKKANPNVTRKEVIDAAVAAGVAYYTARTQYQAWFATCKEVATREASKKS